MSPEELLTDTNRLLRQIVEIDQRQREESERARADFEATQKELEKNRTERLAQAVRDRGVDVNPELLDEDALDRKRQELQRRAKENLEEAKKKQQEHQELLLAELRIQTELLKAIAQRLQA